MTFPNNAQRADWYTNTNEAAPILAALYGTNHRPTYAKAGAGFVASCTCGCDRAEDRRLYPTWHDALDAARTNLRASEHGPSSGKETT